MSSTDNITLEKSEINSDSPQSAPNVPQLEQLLAMPIHDENTALNMLVTFVNLAQRRGSFNLQESAKIWECIQMFMKSAPPSI